MERYRLWRVLERGSGFRGFQALEGFRLERFRLERGIGVRGVEALNLKCLDLATSHFEVFISFPNFNFNF